MEAPKGQRQKKLRKVEYIQGEHDGDDVLTYLRLWGGSEGPGRPEGSDGLGGSDGL
jgi:hypothetical protein